MEALAEGELVLDNGYLRLESVYSDDGYLLIWPYGFSRRTEGEEILIIDGDGKTVARVGDIITVGGGEAIAKVVESAIGQRLSDDCEGPFWIVGDFVEASQPSENAPDKYAEIFEKYKDNPELIDAAIYAEEEGISIEEAVRRFELMNKAGPFGAEIEKNETDTHAGHWIEHKPEFLFVVVFTENGEETIEPYLKSYPDLAEFVEIRTAEYSYVELINAQEEISSDLMVLGIPTASEVDVKANRVNVYIIDRTLIDNAVRDGKLTVPDCVEIITVGELGELEDDPVSSDEYVDELNGSQWALVSIKGSDLVEGTYISLYFRNGGSFWGHSGCNSYGGYYSAKSPDIRIIEMSATEVGCAEIINEQEDAYLNSFYNAVTYSIVDNYLEFYDTANQQLLVFERIPEYAMDPADLAGTSWQIVSMNGANTDEDLSVTLFFDDTVESAHGLVGPYEFQFSCEADGDDIRMGGSVRTVGEPSQELREKAGPCMTGISQAANYRLVSGLLELYTARGETLVFRPYTP